MVTASVVAKVWSQLRREAHDGLKQSTLIGSLVEDLVLTRKDFAASLAAVLGIRLDSEMIRREQLEALFTKEFAAKPQIIESAALDLNAVIERDPACNSLLEPFLFFKGFQAIQAHRVAHSLWKQGQRLDALFLQSIVATAFGVDFHPAAVIGHGILMDHATNVVVGETAVIGNNVSILHGVSLGGNGKDKGDRHPKIGDGVMVGAHAQLLGNIRIGKGAKIGAGAVVLQDVPAHTTFAGVPAVKVGRTVEAMPALEMRQDFTKD